MYDINDRTGLSQGRNTSIEWTQKNNKLVRNAKKWVVLMKVELVMYVIPEANRSRRCGATLHERAQKGRLTPIARLLKSVCG